MNKKYFIVCYFLVFIGCGKNLEFSKCIENINQQKESLLKLDFQIKEINNRFEKNIAIWAHLQAAKHLGALGGQDAIDLKIINALLDSESSQLDKLQRIRDNDMGL